MVKVRGWGSITVGQPNYMAFLNCSDVRGEAGKRLKHTER